MKAKANVTLGCMAYDDEDYVLAVRHLEGAVTELPERPPLDELALRLGTSLQRAGRWQDARPVFARLLARSKTGPSAEMARRRYNWPHEYFAIQSGAFRSSDNARKRVAELQKAGLQAACRPEDNSMRGLHVVYVGRYERWPEAERQLRRVQKVEPQAVIVP